MAFKNKQKEADPIKKKKPTTLEEYKAQGWEVGPYVKMSNPPVYTLTKDGETIQFRPKMKIQPPIKRPPKNPKPEAKPMKDGGSAISERQKAALKGSSKGKKKKEKFDSGHFFKDAKRAGIDFTGFPRMDQPRKKTGRSIGPAGASIVSKDGKRIKQLKKAGKAGLKKLAGRLATRGYGKAK